MSMRVRAEPKQATKLTTDMPLVRPPARNESRPRAAFDLSRVPIHAKSERGGDVDATAARAAATTSVQTAAAPLPHLATVQRAFGRHDLSTVRVHTDDTAARATQSVGANALTFGDRIAFAQKPSLETVAHEAAHVVQHRSGLVAPGKVGRSADREETHAHAVAQRVVQGQSAESLLDVYGSTRGRAGAALHFEKPSANQRYKDALAAKDWDNLVLALADMDEDAIDKRVRTFEPHELQTLIDVAKAKKKKTVQKRLKRRLDIKLFHVAIIAKKWVPAVKQLNKLDRDDAIYLIQHVDAKAQKQLRQAAEDKGLDKVLNAIEIVGLRKKVASLKEIAENEDSSFGAAAGAFAQLADVSHDLSIAETGKGLYEGNRVEGKADKKAKATDCTTIVLEILGKAFEAQGRGGDWKKVQTQMRKNTKARGGTLSGIDLQAALQSVLGWKGIYWAPDPEYRIPTEQLAGHPPDGGITKDEASVTNATAKKSGTYYKKKNQPGVSIDHRVINYAPEKPNKGFGDASTTKKDTSGLEKLKKLPFGVLSGHGADHMTLITHGKVIEVHWDLASNDVDVIEQTDLEVWWIGPKSGYHAFASGAIVAPADEIDKAFK